ncbi:MAG: hypothetical protein GTO46_15185 [Gemmatimonadetes bacterium]|nr:hypothetical protein [Gemmatimonadota bacterium]NIO32982.1 hypothetical protein [Gemmatimonadota bacterium]
MPDKTTYMGGWAWGTTPDPEWGQIALGSAQRYQWLTLFPVIDRQPRHLPYRLLADALEAGTVQVAEVGTGSVPEIAVENRGDKDVLVLDGEQLLGAKQNRTVSRTLILPAHATTSIPVSCMEQGRWRFTSGRFAHKGDHSPSKVRRHAREAEVACTEAMIAAGPAMLARAQGAVWSEIADSLKRSGGRSPTGALDDLYELRARDLDKWTKHFPWVDDQVGLVAFLGDKPLGLDMIGGHRLYARLHKQLVRGYVMDALTAGPTRSVRVAHNASESFVEKARRATRTRAPTVGRGEYRVLSKSVMGGELTDTCGLVHLSAFPVSREKGHN